MRPIWLTLLLLSLSHVFMSAALFYLTEPLKLDRLWAAVCKLGSVEVIFRSRWAGA